jgi:hypothetical protein
LSSLTISGSNTHVASKFEVDVANNIVPIDDVNSAQGLLGFAIVGRKPVGSFDPLAPSTVASHNFLGKVVSGATFAGSAIIGDTVGNIVTITLPKICYKDYSLVNRNELLSYQIPMQLLATNGNDWITLKFS